MCAWNGANGSGNRTVDARRIIFAVLGPRMVAKDYAVDTDRICLSGFSGGGKVARMVAINFANLFKGALYICGILHWKKKPPALIDRVRANRYVFLTGKDDFNRSLSKNIFRKYQSAGLRNIQPMDIPGMAHYVSDTKNFRKAINFLDERK